MNAKPPFQRLTNRNHVEIFETRDYCFVVREAVINLASISVDFIGWVKLCGSYLMVNTHYKKGELRGDCVFQKF
ncbi:hypothetical protein DB44_DT00390 [Candidatus Protochlamydia amoebophila]|uniref:Uncharacterized protein n=1 Tax=Candidatus Protochlamydia amoebophila TaxID=362787 RepID=A0A0C1H0X8_9BACT|nr:hypothetical protein DB44_DT00390 [Candidatus Protochlamydia amoebophila]